MNILYCNKCKKLYKTHIEGEVYCPQENCGEKLVSLDPLIVPVLERFWELGMETDFSCSGHYCGEMDFIADQGKTIRSLSAESYEDGYISFEPFRGYDTLKIDYQVQLINFILKEWSMNEFANSYEVEIGFSLDILDERNRIIRNVSYNDIIPSRNYRFILRVYFKDSTPYFDDKSSPNMYSNFIITNTWFELTKILDKAIYNLRNKEKVINKINLINIL